MSARTRVTRRRARWSSSRSIAASVARLTDIGTFHMPDGEPVATLLLALRGSRRRRRRGARLAQTARRSNRGAWHQRLHPRDDAGARARAPARGGRPDPAVHADALERRNAVAGRFQPSGAAIGLDAFGPTNAQAFAQLFAAQEPDAMSGLRPFRATDLRGAMHGGDRAFAREPARPCRDRWRHRNRARRSGAGA